jgi:hypothetical protein
MKKVLDKMDFISVYCIYQERRTLTALQEYRNLIG